MSLAKARCALAALAILASPHGAGAQEHPSLQRGFAPEKSFQSGDIDSVNLLNGNLVIKIPIGQRYETNGGFSYGLTLFYNSHIWDWQDIQPAGGSQSIAFRLGSNAGLGWTLSLGRVYSPTDTANSTSRWLYVSPDGAAHAFYSTLHDSDGEAIVNGVFYTRDGSYLRLRGATSNTAAVVLIDFPSGQTHTFKSTDSYRPSLMRDPFGNNLAVAYSTAPQKWTLTDNFGRVQTVNFQNAANLPDAVSSITLTTAPGVLPDVYQFAYQTVQLSSACPVTPEAVSPLPYTLLTKITLPDGSSYSMPLTDYDTTTGASCSSTPGYLLGITMPTGGHIGYTYRGYSQISADPSCAPGIRGYLVSSMGVGARTVSSGQVSGQWTYTPVLTPYAHSPSTCDPPREFVNTVKNPLGDKTVSYFSVFRLGATNNEGWLSSEYGLPFTRFQNDGTTRFLSSEVKDCDSAGNNCTTQRQNFLAYEQDKIPVGADETNGDLFNIDSRVASQRRLDLGTTNDFADEAYSRFDGFGHYRQTELAGNYAGGGNSKILNTEYNTEAGSYPAGGIGSTFLQRGATDPWVLGTFKEQTTNDGISTTKVQYCFTRNAAQQATNGFLERRRVYASSDGLAGSHDLVTVNTLDDLGRGNVKTEAFFGGDGQSVTPADICAAALPANRYAIAYTYPEPTTSYWQRTAKYLNPDGSGMSFYTSDETIDPNSGLVTSSRDSAGLQTNYSYGPMGRLLSVQPAQGGRTKYDYVLPTTANPSTTPSVTITRQNNAGTADLAKNRINFDGLGRVWQSQELRPDNGWATRETTYDALGNKNTVSELGTPAKVTSFTLYDPFGRPGRVTHPDAEVTTLINVRFASSTRQVNIGTAWNGSAVTETAAQTQEYFDRQGRLWRVREPSGAGGADVFTNYDYDAGSRIWRASTTSGGVTQTRTFTYDNRGFMSAETHPEKSGAVAYTYDARGHVLTKVDGANALTFNYDRAERPLNIRETGGSQRLLKEFSYASANVGSDKSNGKLRTAIRHNLFTLCSGAHDAAIEETYTYAGLDGAVSQRDTKLRYDGVYGESFTQTFTWSPLGLPDTVGYPTCNSCTPGPLLPARTAKFSYTQGLLSSVGTPTNVTAYASSITYQANGVISTVVHSNGVTDTQAPDPNGMTRPLTISAAAGVTTLWSSSNYAYDGAGNVTRAGSNYYFYDGVSRLQEGEVFLGSSGVSGGFKFERATYDAFGNMKTRSVQTGNNAAVPVDVSTNSSTNQLSAATYDTAGNLQTWSNQTYTYDAFNQATHVTIGGEDWLHFYTADDERIWSYKQGGAPFNRWTLRGLGNEVLREFDSDSTGWHVERDYIHRNGLLLATETPQGVEHFHLDHLGTPRAISNALGIRLAYHAYLPFGEEATATSQDAERRKFTGHERDLASSAVASDQVDYMHARYTNPSLGRFFSTDFVGGNPKGPQSWNRYAYARGNPLRLADPNGRSAMDVVSGVGQGVSNFGSHTVQGVAALFTNPKAVVSGLGQVIKTAGNAYFTSAGRANLAASFNSASTQERTAVFTEALAAGTLAAFGPKAIRSAGGSVEAATTTPMFRAVAPGEATSLAQTGAFAASPTGSMMKGFFFNASDAQSFAGSMTKLTGDQHVVVAAEAPTDLVSSSPVHSAAGEGAGVYITNENLPSVTLIPPIQ